MFSNSMEDLDLRPVPTFPRSVETTQTEFAMNQKLYKPTEYHLCKEKRVLSFEKDPRPSR